MSVKYHILIIPSWYPSSSTDLHGSFFREQAHALKKAGHKVGVIAPTLRSLRDFKGIFKKPYGMSYELDDGINTYRYHSVNFFQRIPNLNIKRWEKIGEKLFKDYIQKNGMPDIIHVHSLIFAGFIAFNINQQYKIPYVVTEHLSSFARGLISSDVIDSLQPVVEEASRCIAVSDEFKKLLNVLFKVNSWIYIPNIVNNNFLTAELKHNKKEQFTFINICFLYRNKRVDILIHAFAQAFKGNKYIRLNIGGDGPEKNNLLKLVKKLGVSEQVEFLGKLTREQVKNQMLNSDAFVLSSEYETFGVVLVEALALGKPIIATKCGGPESIVSKEVGYLVEKNSIDNLAKAMRDLIETYSQFEARQIREYCAIEFSEEAVVKKLEIIYTDILR